MELKISHYDLPQNLTFNYEEIKAALTEKLHTYETMVYTENQIKQAKADRAELNKLKKTLSDERIRREKEYMVPFNEFKDKINELITIIEKPVVLIDAQIKEFEKGKKEEKKETIRKEFDAFGFPDYITFEKVFDEVWLNSSCPLSRVKEDFKTIAYRDEQATKTIKDLPEGAFEAMEYYKQNLDVMAALAKANEIVRMNRAKKAAQEETKHEEIPFNDPEPVEEVEEENGAEVKRVWLKFEARLSVTEATELAAFFAYNKIEYRAIK